MADDSDNQAEGVSQQELLKVCKRKMENWREILIHAYDVLTWDKPFYPGIVAGVITFLFLILWYIDPSVLTTISLFGIIGCLLDYVVPIITPKLFDSTKWSGAQERKYEEVCKSFVSSYMSVKGMWDSTRHVKETRPIVYFAGTLLTLLTTAWIGNTIDNLFLTYLMILSVCLFPGIKSHPMVQEHISKIASQVQGLLGQSKKKK